MKASIVGPNRSVRWWVAALLIVAGGLAPLYRSLAEPSLGWRFVHGPSGTVVAEPVRSGLPELRDVRALEAAGRRVALDPLVTIESAGMHNSFQEQNEFFARHRELWEMLKQPEVRIHHADGVTLAHPEPRDIGELGLRFWFPWLVALLSASVGLGMWIYQPRSSATLCYLVASGGYAFGMLCTASWGSRLLTQQPYGWSELHLASHLASFMLTCGLCVLLWLHPRRLGGNWMPWLLAAAAAVSLAAEQWQWVSGITIAFRLPAVLVGALMTAIYALQWRACRDDPVQRAQLKWFGLLLLVSMSTSFVAYGMGAAGHVVAVPQNYGLAVNALLFLGLVPLVSRVGMFQLEAWWPRAWLWFLGGLLVVVLDMFLVSALHWGPDLAFTVAIALAGWLYFPLRQALWQRLLRGSLPATRDVLPQVLRIVTQGQGDPRMVNERWRQLWETVFQPQRMSAASAASATGITGEGRRLVVAAGPLEPLALELPERGARLFNPDDARRAEELCELVRQGLASSEAFEQGARQERRRIASDLHDDLGAQLLTIAQASMQAQERERIAGMARQALEEMRLSVRGLAGEAAQAADVLADWRSEVVTRLDSAGMDVLWQAEEPPEGLSIPARTHVQLTRVVREAVSNTIKHSGAGRCRVRIAFPEGRLRMEIEDDGRGLGAPARPGGGLGLPNIERRVRSLQGEHRYERPPQGGTRLVVDVPLARQSANIES